MEVDNELAKEKRLSREATLVRQAHAARLEQEVQEVRAANADLAGTKQLPITDLSVRQFAGFDEDAAAARKRRGAAANRKTATARGAAAIRKSIPPAIDPALPDHRQEEPGTGRLGHEQLQRRERALQIQADARHEQKKEDAPAKSRKTTPGLSKEFKANQKQEKQEQKAAKAKKKLAQHSHTYRKPPKPRAERRRVKIDSTEADSAHTGDA
eukprot:COSAG05_NODE_6993_length_869_cov_2.180519_2_plen_211_part_01